jgi:hypothetical protein
MKLKSAVISILIFMLIGAFFLPNSNAKAALCKGANCYGYDPNTMGCGADASSHDYINISDGRVDLRYSDACFAEWERTYNGSGGARYAEGSIRWGYDNYSSDWFPINSSWFIADGETVYTHMYAVSYDYYPTYPPSLNCGSLSTSGPIYPPAQPINLNSTYGQNNCKAW